MTKSDFFFFKMGQPSLCIEKMHTAYGLASFHLFNIDRQKSHTKIIQAKISLNTCVKAPPN
jgi:hypothetical protein